MSKETKFVIAFIASIVLFFFMLNRCQASSFKQSHFQGVILKIRYSDKDTPIVKIKDEEYVIPCRKGDLKIGDSLFKKKNKIIVNQYRSSELIGEYEW